MNQNKFRISDVGFRIYVAGVGRSRASDFGTRRPLPPCAAGERDSLARSPTTVDLRPLPARPAGESDSTPCSLDIGSEHGVSRRLKNLVYLPRKVAGVLSDLVSDLAL